MPGLSIIYSSLILFITTVILVYTIFYNTNHNMLDSKKISKYKIKTLIFSSIISLFFTMIITLISISVDKKKKE